MTPQEILLDPLTAYRFIVTLNPGDAHLPAKQAAMIALYAAGGFQEVRGLGADLEVTPYSEGGVNDKVHQLPVRHSWTRITLKRGLTLGRGLWEWYEAGLTQSLGARRDGAILLMSPAGAVMAAWEFYGGLAAKWTGPEFNAMQNAVAVESVEIAHEGVKQVLSP
ncbi:MAG TPA: phage tail protein [Pyrinomonadaceae bacterium]|nr:phage tail protein [Pyrinomonadaceae bacterium]